MKRLLIISAVIVLIMSNIYLVSALIWQKFISEGENSDGFIKEKYAAVYNGMDYLLLNGGLPIDSADISGLDADTPFLPASFFSSEEDRCMVCRISQYDCESCTDYALEKFVQKTRKWNMKLIVLADYRNSKEIGLVRNNHSGTENLDYFIMGSSGLPIDEVGMPYYFILDSGMRVNDVFVPVEMLPDLTNRYFSKLENKYCLAR